MKRLKTELDILRDVSERLDSAGIAFMVTGSVAMNYYAQPRMTRDIDVVMVARRQPVTIADFQTWIVSLEDLIRSKLYWAKDSRAELQLQDVRNLLRLDCDRDYLRSRAKILGVEQLLEELLTENERYS